MTSSEIRKRSANTEGRKTLIRLEKVLTSDKSVSIIHRRAASCSSSGGSDAAEPAAATRWPRWPTLRQSPANLGQVICANRGLYNNQGF